MSATANGRGKPPLITCKRGDEVNSGGRLIGKTIVGQGVDFSSLAVVKRGEKIPIELTRH